MRQREPTGSLTLAGSLCWEGVEGLLRDKTRSAGKVPLTTAKLAEILALTCSEPPSEVIYWTGRTMAKEGPRLFDAPAPRRIDRISYVAQDRRRLATL